MKSEHKRYSDFLHVLKSQSQAGTITNSEQ